MSEITGQKHEMKAAGLVVRLMGLESLPTVNDKQKKASNSDVEEDKFDDLNSGKGSVKVECRPQKLQKTGQFDRSAVTRFGAEALQIKKVLSRSRKEQYSKLASPVKSPRLSSSRNVSRTSRLIDVASRILEPGLQATSRAKCAISYTGSMNYAQKSEGLVDGVGLGAMPTDLGAAKSFGGQSSCRNCGNLIEANGFKPEIEKQASAYPFSAEKMSLQGSERIVLRPTVHDLEQEGPEGLKHDNKRACNDETSATVFQQRTETRTNMSVGRSRNQPQRPQKDEMSVGRSRIPSKAKSNNLQNRKACSTGNAITGAKDFVALNRSLSSSSPSRVLSKVDNCSPRDDSLSQARTPVRKRRTGSVNTQPESTGIANSKPVRPKNIKCDLVGGKRLEPNAPNGSQECIKARTSSSSQGAFKDHDAVSFTFNSQLRHKNLISPRLTKTRDQIDKIPNGLLFEEKEGKTFFKGKMPLNGDSLGALLELKLKELTSQGEDELMVGGKRSTAVILQELISALTAQQPFSPNSPMEVLSFFAIFLMVV